MTQNDQNILIYSTTWCSDCKRAKKFFGEQRIPYTNIDIEENPEFVEVVEKINDGNMVWVNTKQIVVMKDKVVLYRYIKKREADGFVVDFGE